MVHTFTSTQALNPFERVAGLVSGRKLRIDLRRLMGSPWQFYARFCKSGSWDVGGKVVFMKAFLTLYRYNCILHVQNHSPRHEQNASAEFRFPLTAAVGP